MSSRASLKAAVVLATALVAGCGGGDDKHDRLSCSIPDQKAWLRDYMGDWYFWHRLSPRPDPAGFTDVADYFPALLYPGGDPDFPVEDLWSFFEPTESFDRFFGEGRTLGYGVFVAGAEVAGQPDAPLFVRYVEPQSPAGLAGVARGDRVLAINGRPAPDVIAANDFGALVPAAAGDTLTLELGNAVGEQRRIVTLTADVFDLTPVPVARTYTTATGRRIGYVVVKDMIRQVLSPLTSAFQGFRNQGVHDVVLDLRYNSGGLVSTAAEVASQVAGARAKGQPFATLLYNDRHPDRNESFLFGNPASALGLPRVYVLAGVRTCSASEQVINGLRPFADVVVVGDTTCGKPVGTLPRDNCGLTYSAVNFETINASDEGRYFFGFAPSALADGSDACNVPEDFTAPLGDPGEPLLAAAMRHADTGVCGGVLAREAPLALKLKAQGRRPVEPGERARMIGR